MLTQITWTSTIIGNRLSDYSDEFPMKTLRYRCPKSMHLRSPQDFGRIYKDGQRAGDDHLLVFATANDWNVNRLGLSISRKHGGAVHRNLKRRRIREAFRLLQHDLPKSYDVIVVPRQRADSVLQDYRNSLRTLVRLIARRTMMDQETSCPRPIMMPVRPMMPEQICERSAGERRRQTG